jgi:phage shock protein C
MNNKVLRKSQHRMLAGVCAGIAEYLCWRPVQIRWLFILITIIGGSGIIAYLLLATMMPPAGDSYTNSFNLDNFKTNQFHFNEANYPVNQ